MLFGLEMKSYVTNLSGRAVSWDFHNLACENMETFCQRKKILDSWCPSFSDLLKLVRASSPRHDLESRLRNSKSLFKNKCCRSISINLLFEGLNGFCPSHNVSEKFVYRLQYYLSLDGRYVLKETWSYVSRRKQEFTAPRLCPMGVSLQRVDYPEE